jgi:hypothetical protein
MCIGELAAWANHRSRRVATRTATKNQLLGQLDRAFPGLTLALPDVLGTEIGRLVAAEFADPGDIHNHIMGSHRPRWGPSVNNASTTWARAFSLKPTPT